MGPWPLFEGNALIVVPSLYINIYYTRHDVTIDTCLEIVKPFSFLISKQTFWSLMMILGGFWMQVL
jgi:hypothetical protein